MEIVMMVLAVISAVCELLSGSPDFVTLAWMFIAFLGYLNIHMIKK